MRSRVLTIAAALSAAVMLFALGAATRPLISGDEDKGTAAPVLNPTEIGFVQDMLAHHNQALIMVSRLDSSAAPEIRALAGRIDDTQRSEIGQFLGWLRLAGAPTTNPEPMAWMHRDEGTGHHDTGPATTEHNAPESGLMPGMAGRAELDALSSARGADAGTLFLQLMQRHHYGGIEMATAADRLLDSGVVKQTARDMMTTQGQEAGLMGVLLTGFAR